MDVYTLGTGAPLAPSRASTGLLVEAEGCGPLLIDTCSGFEIIRRLYALDKTPEDHHHVILTHRHGDHIGGVMALALAVQPLHLYGPEDALKAAKHLLEITYGEISERVLKQTYFHPKAPETPYTIAGYEVTFFEVQHRVPTYAVRLEHEGKVLAFSADSVPCENVVRCARGADLFLCDGMCSIQDEMSRVKSTKALGHPNAAEAAQMAEEAQAKALALVHIARGGTPSKMLEDAKAIFSGPVTVPDDNQHFVL